MPDGKNFVLTWESVNEKNILQRSLTVSIHFAPCTFPTPYMHQALSAIGQVVHTSLWPLPLYLRATMLEKLAQQFRKTFLQGNGQQQTNCAQKSLPNHNVIAKKNATKPKQNVSHIFSWAEMSMATPKLLDTEVKEITISSDFSNLPWYISVKV